MIQFLAPKSWPYRMRQIATEKGIPSNGQYIRMALCRALSEDLGVPIGEIEAELPPTLVMNRNGKFTPRDLHAEAKTG